MQNSEYPIPIPAVSLRQALTDIIESTAAEEAALGQILTAESELLETAKKNSDDVGEFSDLNTSVGGILRSITALQLFIHYQWEDAGKLLQDVDNCSAYDEMEE